MKSRRRQSFLVAGLCIAAAMIGCDRQAQSTPPTPEVAVVTIQPTRAVLTTELPGRTSAHLVSEVRPRVSGLIQKRLFEEGSNVEAGQLLYEIDPAPFQAAHDSAEANLNAAQKATDRARAALGMSNAGVSKQQSVLDLAKINLRRMEDLVKDHAVSDSERDQAATDVEVAKASLQAAEAQVDSDRAEVAAAEAAIKQAQAALETARIDLSYTKITAPISGRIGRSEVTDGATVTAYQPLALATIQQLDPIYVDVPQATNELLRLKRRINEGLLNRNGDGQNRVGLILEDGFGYPLQGTLQFTDVSVDPSTGSVILRMVFPNPDGELLPGMFVRAVITEGVNENAILAPQQAVSRNAQGDPVALIVDADGKVAQVILDVDRAIGNQWLVTAGLSPGDRVIVEGIQKVRPGATVRTVPFVAAPEPGNETAAVR